MAEELPPPPTDKDLRRLARFRARDGVLSVYLDFDPASGERAAVRGALLSSLQDAADHPFAVRHGDRFDEERQRMLDRLGDHKLRSRSLVAFSCAPRDLWDVYELQVPVRPVARFAERPVVAPLTAALDEHERFGVAVVDKEEARIMTVYLGRIEHRTELSSSYPGRTAAGGWSQARYERHREDHLHRHLLRTVDAIRKEARRHGFDRLIVGGPDEARHGLLSLLPEGLRSRVAGTFGAELFASDHEVLERVREIEEEAERRSEEQLVADVIESGKGTGPATLGWSQTLQALGEGRVHRLVRAQGVTRRGRVCPEGHFATIERLARCPVCNEHMTTRRDIMEWAIEQAYDTDATVEEVRGDAARALKREGGIAAVLRY
jgi:peptide chain release factor subunit 1